MKQLQWESRKDVKARVVQELIYEVCILKKLSDHPGLPLLFGACTDSTPHCLIMQFHGDQDRSSLAISHKLSKKRKSDKMTWTRIIVKTSEALACVHEKGFFHNDLKANVVLENNGGVYNPVVIDLGKSIPINDARGPKVLSEEKKEAICEGFP